jgi:atlastin
LFQLAVMILDTQGIFDKDTSQADNAFIFSLSTLVTSTLIFNLHERIQMDDMQNLKVLFFRMLMKDISFFFIA